MRLKSGIWVNAYIRVCAAEDIPAVVARRGQDDGGAIFIVVDRLDGTLNLYEPAPAGFSASDTERFWVPSFGGKATDADEVNAYLERQAEFDPDLWIIAVEDKGGRHFLGSSLVSA